MKRVLMYASVASMIQQFNMDNIRLLLELGYEVDVACNMEQGSTITQEKIEAMRQELEEMGVTVFHIPLPRQVTAVREILKSFRMSKALMNDREYDLIHCHSPIGGMVCRLANRFRKGYRKTKMIYTAHGFHFFQGASLKNWLIYYPVELFCSYFTDVLITINQEDYTLAQREMHAGRVIYVPGIGVNTGKFLSDHSGDAEKRRELGLNDADHLILSVGELSERKNHEVIIRALAKIENQDTKYLIGGIGAKEEYLRELIEQLGLEERVLLLGYRTDVAQLLNIADIYAFPSLQEGLPVALMEAMSVGKAVVCSKIRGNTDLIQDGLGGYLKDPMDAEGFAEAIGGLLDNEELRARMGEINREKMKMFDIHTVNAEMKKIYADVSKEREIVADKQKVCFILARMKGDYCFDKIIESGYRALIPYKDFNLLLRCMREAWFRLKLPCRKIWYNGRCKREDAQLYIVRDSLIEPDFVQWLRECHPSARIVLDYENLAKKTLDPDRIKDPMVEKWSYDDGDCAQYGMKQKGISYYDAWKMEKTVPPVYDVVYVGRDKGRAEMLFALEAELKGLGLQTCFHICADRKFLRYTKPYYKKLLTYAEYLNLAGQGRAILNVAQEGCVNITLREIEAVFHSIKCITTNAAVKQFKLYDPSRYFILGEDRTEDLPAFLNMSFRNVSAEELDEFCFDHYVERIYRG